MFVQPNMAKEFPEMSDIHTETKENQRELSMSAVAEAATLLEELAEPIPSSRKAMFNRMAERVRKYGRFTLSPGRAEDLWRQEARLVRAEEMDAIRAAKERLQEAKARDNARTLITTYLAAAARLRQTDEDYHSAEIARLEHAAHALGALDRSRCDEDA